MFRRIHWQFTFFCTLVTGSILIVLTCICLYISQSAAAKNSYASFQNNLSAMLTHLEDQTILSHQWIAQMEGSNHFLLDIRDNGQPLFYDTLNRTEEERQVFAQAEAIARETYDIDVTKANTWNTLSRHMEFSMTSQAGLDYYVSAALLPREKGSLSVLTLYPLDLEQAQAKSQRFLFALADAAALILLGIFSWFFTARMLRPIQESRERQMQFIAAASHELRSPLTVILSSLSAMEIAPKEEAKRFSKAIQSEGSRMSRLINDMLTLANADNRNWSIHPEEVELDTLLLQTYEKYSSIVRQKGRFLSISLPEQAIPTCRCDGERIAQVLSILIDNAISYTQEGGKIQLSLTLHGNKAQLRVADNGPGVPDEAKAAVFQRFYRADRAHKDKNHFGLGLCIGYEIVKLHKGKLWIEDTPGGGATFVVGLNVGGK